ncbi:MAG TPA: hypothetical protein VGK23_12920 [Methanomassiliicoccales archaeon]
MPNGPVIGIVTLNSVLPMVMGAISSPLPFPLGLDPIESGSVKSLPEWLARLGLRAVVRLVLLLDAGE